MNSLKRRSISNVILGFLSSIHVFGQCLLGSRPLTLHQHLRFCQTIQTMSAQSAYQAGSASDLDCDSRWSWMLDVFETFWIFYEHFWFFHSHLEMWPNQIVVGTRKKKDHYWYHVHFWGCGNFKSVLKILISIFQVLWRMLQLLGSVVFCFCIKISVPLVVLV